MDGRKREIFDFDISGIDPPDKVYSPKTSLVM